MSDDHLTEVALNVIGFFASGALMLVFHAMFNRKNKHEVSVTADTMTRKYQEPVIDTAVEPCGKVEFVNFETNSGKVARQAERETETVNVSSNFQTNRHGVIKQVREMLISARGTSDVRRKLTIAEVELNMINQQRNNWSRRGAANDQ